MKQADEIIDKASKFLITSMVNKLEPIVVTEAKGAVIKDIVGKEYIDCFAGISVVNVGHGQPEILEAAINQAKILVHAGSYVYYVLPTVKLAEKIAEITPPPLQKSFFGTSGAEAVECAMKLARKYTKKPEFIALMGSFHGRTLGTLSITGLAGRRKYDMGPYLPGISFAPSHIVTVVRLERSIQNATYSAQKRCKTLLPIPPAKVLQPSLLSQSWEKEE